MGIRLRWIQMAMIWQTTPKPLPRLGFTDEELTKLSESYSAGNTLWRVPIDHFSSWDCNFGAYPPADADIPWFKPDKKNRPDPCKQAGSIIDTANMGLGESVPWWDYPSNFTTAPTACLDLLTVRRSASGMTRLRTASNASW